MSNFTKLKLCHTLGISQSTHIWVKGALTALLLVLCGNVAKAQTYQYQSFDASKNYTKILIDAKINDFAGNTKPMGFGSYDAASETITQPTWYTAMDKKTSRKLEMDYVAGLVAKACIEAADYYKDFTWSKPWFKLVENYATQVTVPTTGASLDDLNAAKMYFALAELTKKGAKYENSTTYNKAITELKNALTGLTAVNKNYSIRSGSTVNYYSDKDGNQTWKLVDAKGNELSPATSGNMNAIGGWYHKATYPNQMWCDSEYMGPALLAQLVAYAANNTSAGIGTITGTTEGDWKLIAKQFDITWNYLWNSTDKLLYHGFSATPTAVGAHTYTWATGTNGTNTAYWGRAIGWYFLALVDVLENMPDNISDNSYTSTQDNLKNKDANIKTRLTSYLTDLADGIWAQMKDNNLWTNVINEAVGTEHTSYSTTRDALQSNKKNYLEASASAIYIATYLKAMRLGLLSSDTYRPSIETAYKNYFNNFITTDNTIINTCASAGLGGGSVNISSANSDYNSGGKRYRNGTADYYTRGYDVTKITDYQEGKPLGAFILASTEYERFIKADYTPSFTAEYAEVPTAQTVTKGQSVTLHAAAMAKPLAKYQWYSYPASDAQASKAKRAATTGTAISGATSSDLTVTPEANTYYYCVATNDAGSAQTEPVLLTVSEGGNEGTNTPTETTDLFTLTGVTSTTVNVSSKSSVDVSSEYATITGGSAQLYNGHADAKNMIVGSQINLSGSSSSYLKITLDNALEVGDVITITPTASQFKLSATSSDSGDKSISGSYVIKEGDAVVGKNVIYIYKVDSSSKIETIKITRNNRESDSRATFTYGGSQLTFTTTSEGTYTTTLEVGASKRGKDISITPTAQEGTSIKEGDTPVTSTITITAPSTTGTTEAHTYTVTSKDGSSTTTYIINVKVVKEKITLVYSDINGNTEWTWNSTTTPTKPTFNSPTVKAYIKNAEGKDELLTDASLSYTYVSDVTSVATVSESGTITIVGSGNGGAKIYATLNENDNYDADPAFFDVLLEQGYSFSVGENETAPVINTSKYIKRTTPEGTENLVKMTFGGWKWEGLAKADATTKTLGSYKVVRGDKTTYYTDKWNDSGTKASDIASIDGHYYWWNGQNDAVDESKAPSNENIYGSIRYGWFKSPEHDGDGKTTVSYPFTLPVRGSYMTFEPTMNGTLTIYILQNGAWNTNDDGGTYEQGADGSITYKKGDIIPGVFRPHAFQVVNQRGLTVQEFSPKYSVSTKQKVDSRYYCMFESEIAENSETDNAKYYNPHNVARWTEFADYMSTEEKQRAHDSWNSGPLGAQKIIELDNGSFLAVQKGIVKYTFHVTGNETYYFFSNFSKMGFSGANFVPDEAQPEKTVSGKISTLELSDVTAYNEITATENVIIEGTTLKNYTYKIGETEIARVDGVSIPQFYSIKLTRTFKPGQWTTLTLPFNLTQEEVQRIFGAETQIIMLDEATLSSEGGARLHFFYHEIQNVLPGYPYLIKPTLTNIKNDANVEVIKDNNTITSFTVFGKCINPFINQFEVNTTPYTFKGTPGYCTANVTKQNSDTKYSVKYEQNDIFVSDGDGKLYVSGGSSYGKGYRAWLQKRGTTPVKSISVVMSSFSDDDDTTTSIDVAEMAPDLIEALGIQTGVYNLSGQRVANDTRNLKAGIYIVNGKKTVVR